jgi:hypothetical protein
MHWPSFCRTWTGELSRLCRAVERLAEHQKIRQPSLVRRAPNTAPCGCLAPQPLAPGICSSPPHQNCSPHNLRLNFSHGSSHRHRPPIKQPAALPGTVFACHELIQQLLQDLDVLRERVNLNSGNSSKPPSSDGPQTPLAPPKLKATNAWAASLGTRAAFALSCPRTSSRARSCARLHPSARPAAAQLMPTAISPCATRSLSCPRLSPS